MDDFQVFIVREPGNVQIKKVTLPDGTVLEPLEGVIDITPMKRFAFFEFIMHINHNTVQYEKQKCLFYGIKKGQDGFDAMHYEVLKQLPIKG